MLSSIQVFGIQMFTVFFLIVLSGRIVFIPEFAQMCGKLMGRFWEYLGSFFSLLAVTGAAVVYWVLMSNFFYNTVTFIYGKGTFVNDVGQ